MHFDPPRHAPLLLLVASLFVGACDTTAPCGDCDDGAVPDAPVEQRDGGAADAGAGADAGAIDVGAIADAGMADVGTITDAGMADAGASTDAGVDGGVPDRWHVEEVATTGYSDLDLSVALDGERRAIAWWDDHTLRGTVAQRGPSGWSIAFVDDVPYSGVDMNIAYDSVGRLRALYHDTPANDLVYGVRDDAGVWHRSRILGERALGWLAHATLVGDVFHSLSEDGDGARGIAYVFGDGTDWTQERVYTNPGPASSSGTGTHGIAMHEGRVFGLLIQGQNTPLASNALLAERTVDGVWSTELIHAGVNEWLGAASLAVDGAGIPHVCLDGWDGAELIHAERVDGEWRRETIASETGDHACAIAAGPDGRLHLVHGIGRDIRYTVREGGVWSPDVVIDPRTGAVLAIDLRLDDAGRPHVAYVTQRGGSGVLSFAWLGP